MNSARRAWLAAGCVLALGLGAGACKKNRVERCGVAGEVPDPVRPSPARGALEPAPWLRGGRRVVILERDGARLIAAAGRRWVRLFDVRGMLRGEANGVGMAQALHVADLDGDGAQDLVVGRGRGRGVMSAPSSVVVHMGGRLDAPPEVIELPATTRAQVVGVASDPRRPGRLWIGSFESKYMVALVEATRIGPGRWRTRVVGRHRVVVSVTATDLDRNGASELVAARPYGDTKEQAGFAFVASAPLEHLPTVGGARAVAAADHGALVIVAEGWNYRYGQDARALVATYRKRLCGWDRRVLAHVAGRFGYDRLVVADVDGDGLSDVISTGDGPAIYVAIHGRSEVRALGDDVAYDAAVADLDGDGRPEVVLVGKGPGIWRVPRGS